VTVIYTPYKSHIPLLLGRVDVAFVLAVASETLPRKYDSFPLETPPYRNRLRHPKTSCFLSCTPSAASHFDKTAFLIEITSK
jgi:hypothetical protein